MKYKMKKEEFDALSEDLQKLYTETDGEYVLQVEGLPEPKKDDGDNSGLVKKNKELLDEVKQFKAKAREEEAAKAKAEEEAAKKAGDIEAHNGKVIATSTLSGKPHSAKLAVRKATLG